MKMTSSRVFVSFLDDTLCSMVIEVLAVMHPCKITIEYHLGTIQKIVIKSSSSLESYQSKQPTLVAWFSLHKSTSALLCLDAFRVKTPICNRARYHVACSLPLNHLYKELY